MENSLFKAVFLVVCASKSRFIWILFLFSIHFFHEVLQTQSEMSFKGPWFHARHSAHVPRLDYADVPGGNNDLNFLAHSKACMEHDWFLGSFWALLVLCSSKPKWPVRPCSVFQISSPPAFATLAIQQHKLTKWPWGSENFFSRCRSLHIIDLWWWFAKKKVALNTCLSL